MLILFFSLNVYPNDLCLKEYEENYSEAEKELTEYLYEKDHIDDDTIYYIYNNKMELLYMNSSIKYLPCSFKIKLEYLTCINNKKYYMMF